MNMNGSKEEYLVVIGRDPEENEYRRESWTQNGMLHRADGPAVIYSDDAGRKVGEEWHFRGKLHREGGPAKLWDVANATVWMAPPRCGEILKPASQWSRLGMSMARFTVSTGRLRSYETKQPA